MGRTCRAFLTIVPVALSLFLTACASGKRPQPLPAVDPVKEQITILQKQFLELQNMQNETRRKVDEQAAAVSALDARVSAMEAQRVSSHTVRSPAPSASGAGVKSAPKQAPSQRRMP